MDNQTSKESPTCALTCSCGRFQGTLNLRGWHLHARCYCGSCQAFAKELDATEHVLDERGGTDVLITSPAFVSIDKGLDQLACIQLTPEGPIRWYASCCNTPIGNTPASPQKAIISMVHACLGGRGQLETTFGPAKAIVHTGQAKGEPKPDKLVSKTLKLSIASRLISARLTGAWRKTPFFDSEGKPVVTPAKPASAG